VGWAPSSRGRGCGDGEAHHDGSHDVHAVTRLQLAGYSFTLRGDRPRLAIDVPAAQEYCRDNLISYWLPVLDGSDEVIAVRAPSPDGVIWVGLGPARLWHTIRTGEIVSKSRAGELAAAAWPDLADPLHDIIAARAGHDVELTARHGHAAVELGRRILVMARES
jgi:hypothetical protein